jgi:Transglutaminase-like superfamily
VSGHRHSWAERWLLVQAAGALCIAQVAVKILRFRFIVRVLGLRERGARNTGEGTDVARAERIRWAIRAAAALLPWDSTCLTQSLGAAALLRFHGMPGTLSLGVAKGDSVADGVLAHAWVQSGDLVVTGEHGSEGYAELTRFATR